MTSDRPETPRRRALRLVLVVVVALGLVLMHHLVAAHQHQPEHALPGPAPSGHAAPTHAGPTHATPLHAGEHGSPVADVPAADVPAPTLHVHTASTGAPGGSDGHAAHALLHQCLAVLAAAVALLAGLVAVGALRWPSGDPAGRPARPRAVGREPPVRVPLRLAQLQVLRL